MNKEQARTLIQNLFESPFDKTNFITFISNLLKTYERKSIQYPLESLPSNLIKFVHSYEVIGSYTTPKEEHLDILVISLSKNTTLFRARSTLRNIVASYLKNTGKDAALVAFVSPTEEDWRFSFVKAEHSISIPSDGRIKIQKQLTSPKRFSYIVGKNEISHTAQSRFVPLLTQDAFPSLDEILEAFSVDKVTEEFFEAFRYALFEVIIKNLIVPNEVSFKEKHAFSLQLLSRLMFIYFLQKKGWLKWKDYEPDKRYLRNLWLKYKNSDSETNTFYSVWLKSLFFGAFNKNFTFFQENLPDEIKASFELMPFLNGGLFMKNEVDNLVIDIPDKVFEWLFEPGPFDNDNKKGFLEIFNFTIDESLPYDVEVAIDPEMLGKVYESLITEEERGSSGIFYTPRVEIDYMCRNALVEYMVQHTEIPKEQLIKFVYEPDQLTSLERDQIVAIKKSLDNLKVVDPAVGSASFLVSMMNILVELHSAISRILYDKEENLFALKEKIINENLYGVDIKNWAVQIAELRLWLSLIIDTDEKYMDIYTTPLLPHLSFKIRQGDSLIEEINNVPISFRNTLYRYLPNRIKNKIKLLKQKKTEYFRERSADLKEKKAIEELEASLLKDIILKVLNDLEKEKSELASFIQTQSKQMSMFEETLEQKSLFEREIRKKKTEIQNITHQINNLRSLLSNISDIKKKEKDFFLWEIEFAEVFGEKGGFDIVIGNPPYVRQEKIAPPLLNERDFTPTQWRSLKKGYKEKLQKMVENLYGKQFKPDGKADLYVYFYFKSLSLLNQKGVFSFITSNSWLDVGFGRALQEFLLRKVKIYSINDNQSKRSFKEADVNTIIIFTSAPSNKEKENLENIAKFVMWKKPFEEAINKQNLMDIDKIGIKVENKPLPELVKNIIKTEDYRVFPIKQKDLYCDGVSTEEDKQKSITSDCTKLSYEGNKWGGKFLRAPDIFFTILEKGKDKLVRLGDIVEVRFGIKTGANEFFYVEDWTDIITEKELEKIENLKGLSSINEIKEKGLRVIKPSKWGSNAKDYKLFLIEEEFLKPVIKSPRELKTIIVREEDLKYKVFMCNKSKKELKNSFALDYIKWGEKQSFHKRPTCASRREWWRLNISEFSDFLWVMTYRERFFVAMNKNFLVDARFYDIYLNDKGLKNKLGLVLNSTLTLFYIELMSRTYGGGGGPVDVKVYEVKEMYIPVITENIANNILKNKKIDTIFTELGFDPDRPIREQEPNPLPDRKALDDIVFDALGLTEEERKEVYYAVAELVQNRLKKAKNV